MNIKITIFLSLLISITKAFGTSQNEPNSDSLTDIDRDVFDFEDENLVQLVVAEKPLPPGPAPKSYINFMGAAGQTGDCFKDFPYLKQRFTFDQLEIFCQQKRQFDKAVFGNETITPFTDDQQKYLDSLKMDMDRQATELNPLAIRKEIRMLSNEERRLFGWALRSLKRSKIDGVSKYDLLVLLHHPTQAPGSYVGAAFLPWHREYLRTFEAALRQEHPYVSVPYWDSTLDSDLPDARDSVLWHPRFFGNRYGQVVAGPFARAEFVAPNSTQPTPLYRNVTLSDDAHPMKLDDVRFVIDTNNYKDMTACSSVRLEQASRAVHSFIGGSMADVYYSPQDFIFFLHYAFLDKLWQDWMDNASQMQLLYPPNFEACTEWHYARSPMRPFEPLENIDGLSPVYTHYYAYEPTPSTCHTQQDCSSVEGYLFCNTQLQRCQSKVVLGGNCTGLDDFDSCYMSQCAGGLCIKQQPKVVHIEEILHEELLQNDGSGQ